MAGRYDPVKCPNCGTWWRADEHRCPTTFTWQKDQPMGRFDTNTYTVRCTCPPNRGDNYAGTCPIHDVQVTYTTGLCAR
jgi:hypothetical protein